MSKTSYYTQRIKILFLDAETKEVIRRNFSVHEKKEYPHNTWYTTPIIEGEGESWLYPDDDLENLCNFSLIESQLISYGYDIQSFSKDEFERTTDPATGITYAPDTICCYLKKL